MHTTAAPACRRQLRERATFRDAPPGPSEWFQLREHAFRVALCQCAAVFAFIAFSKNLNVHVLPRCRSRANSYGMTTPASSSPAEMPSPICSAEK